MSMDVSEPSYQRRVPECRSPTLTNGAAHMLAKDNIIAMIMRAKVIETPSTRSDGGLGNHRLAKKSNAKRRIAARLAN